MQKSAPPPLLPLLRSRLQAEVLTLVLLNPDREWTLTELASRVGVAPSSNSPGPAGDDIDDAIAVATRAREAATTILDQNVLSRW